MKKTKLSKNSMVENSIGSKKKIQNEIEFKILKKIFVVLVLLSLINPFNVNATGFDENQKKLYKELVEKEKFVFDDGKTREKNNKFSNLYEKKETINTVSVNGGNDTLDLGGGGINRQFADDLKPMKADFKAIHSLKKKSEKDGVFYAEKVGSSTSASYLTFFKSTKRPHDNNKNVGMIYTIGPDCRSGYEKNHVLKN
jgi:hypothetical protein